jgi:hypothetical protein
MQNSRQLGDNVHTFTPTYGANGGGDLLAHFKVRKARSRCSLYVLLGRLGAKAHLDLLSGRVDPANVEKGNQIGL